MDPVMQLSWDVLLRTMSEYHIAGICCIGPNPPFHNDIPEYANRIAAQVMMQIYQHLEHTVLAEHVLRSLVLRRLKPRVGVCCDA